MDSYGSIWPSGRVNGLYSDFGDYFECLSIESPKFKNDLSVNGKYCLLSLIVPFPKLSTLKIDESYITVQNLFIGSDDIISMIYSLNKNNGTSYQMGICIPSQCSAHEIEHLLNAGMF